MSAKVPVNFTGKLTRNSGLLQVRVERKHLPNVYFSLREASKHLPSRPKHLQPAPTVPRARPGGGPLPHSPLCTPSTGRWWAAGWGLGPTRCSQQNSRANFMSATATRGTTPLRRKCIFTAREPGPTIGWIARRRARSWWKWREFTTPRRGPSTSSLSPFKTLTHDMNFRARSAASIAGDLAFTIRSPSKSRQRK